MFFGTSGSWEAADNAKAEGKGGKRQQPTEVYAFGAAQIGSSWTGNENAAHGTDVFVSAGEPGCYYLHWTPRPMDEYMATESNEWQAMGYVRWDSESGFECDDDTQIWGYRGKALRGKNLKGKTTLPVESKGGGKGVSNIGHGAKGKGKRGSSNDGKGVATR